MVAGSAHRGQVSQDAVALRAADRCANLAPTATLVAEPLKPSTRRAVLGFRLRAALRSSRVTRPLLEAAKRLVRGGSR